MIIINRQSKAVCTNQSENSRRSRYTLTVNDRIFLNNASFGLYTEIIEDRERHKRVLGRSRWVALLSVILMGLRSHSPRRIK